MLFFTVFPVLESIETASEFSLAKRNSHFKVERASLVMPYTFGALSCLMYFPSLKSSLEMVIGGTSLVLISALLT